MYLKKKKGGAGTSVSETICINSNDVYYVTLQNFQNVPFVSKQNVIYLNSVSSRTIKLQVVR